MQLEQPPEPQATITDSFSLRREIEAIERLLKETSEPTQHANLQKLLVDFHDTETKYQKKKTIPVGLNH
jgi:hypothetical protein